MDAVQQFAAQLQVPVPETFVIGGASKVSIASISSGKHENLSLFYSMDGRVSR